MRVVLVCHAVTEGLRQACFGGDHPPTPAGLAAASLVPARADRWLSAPSTACRLTADALRSSVRPGAPAAPAPTRPRVVVDERLAGCAYGRWTGRPLAEIQTTEPDALGQWLADPDAAPHGGESLTALHGRVGGWLDGQDPGPGTVLAVADPAVIRAAVVHAVQAGPRSVWRIDIAPLGRVVLTGGPGRWSLRELVRRP